MSFYTVTVVDKDEGVLHEAFEMFNFLGPAKSYARNMMGDKELIAAGARRIRIVNEDSTVLFDESV